MESEEEMKAWHEVIPDPRNTRGRLTLFKKTLYLYWIMKSLMGKAMEQPSMGMEMTLQDMPNYKKNLQAIQFQLCKQDIRLDRIQRHIPCIIELEDAVGDSAEDPALVDSALEDRKE